jgi:hypothetical protein
MSELDPSLIAAIEAIPEPPRLWRVVHLDDAQRFEVSYPDGLEEDTVEHWAVDPVTLGRRLIGRLSLKEEIDLSSAA